MNDASIIFLGGDDCPPNPPTSPGPRPKYPYPGLRPFKTEEAAIFYGRNSQKDAILERLNQSRMVFVLGSSGCGKSSLIKAGVIPALKAGLLTKEGYEWEVIMMRPGRRPLDSLAKAFSEITQLTRKLESVRKDGPAEGGSTIMIAEDRAESGFMGGPAKSLGVQDHAKAEFPADLQKPGPRSDREQPSAPQRDCAPSDATEFLACFENEGEGLWSATSLLPAALREGSGKNTARYLLLVDQFEEIFGSQIEKPDEVDRFAKLLTVQYARPHPALFVVFTMRSDYLGNCSSFPGLSEAVNNCSYLTPILTASELREAIERPAWDYGASVEAQLVDTILAEMHAGTNYDSDNLPLMQHALLWLWQRATSIGLKESQMRLTAKDYKEYGGMRGILKKHADEMLRVAEGENREYRPIAETLFRRLSEEDDQGRFRRSPATFAEVTKIAACRDDELEDVIKPFAEEKASFVEIRPADKTGERLLDVSHEALIRTWDQARDWAVLERRKIEKFRNYLNRATAWRGTDQNSKSLEGQPGLDEFERWWQSSKPSGGWFHRYFASDTDARGNYSSADDAAACVDRFRLASLKADRFRRLRIRALEALALILIVFVPWYVAYSAHLNTEKARAQAIADRAEYVLGNQGPAKALLIAVQAEKHALPDLPKTERVLISALRQLRERRVISGLSSPVFGLAYSPDGSVIASLDSRSLRFWDAHTGEPIETVPLDATGSFGLTWSREGDWIGVNLGDKAILLRPCSYKKIRPLFRTCEPRDKDQTLTLGDSQNAGGLPRFSADGKWVATASRTEPPVLWNIATGSAMRLASKKVPMPYDVAISPDMKSIALGLEDSAIQLVDPVTGAAQILTASSETSSNVLAVEFNPADSNMLAASLQNGQILIWNIRNKTSATLAGSGGIAYSLGFSRDGKFITASSDDRVIRTWQTDRPWQKPFALRGHAGPVYLVAYGSDGHSLASGSADKTILIWDLHSPLFSESEYAPSLASSNSNNPAERPSWISSITLPPKFDVLAYAREGDRAVVAAKDGRLALFIVGTDTRPIALWQGPEHIASLSIEHHPDRIVAISTDGEHYSRPFFPSIHELVQFAEDHIPFDGDHRLALSKDELCAVSPPDAGCPSDDALTELR